LRLHRIILTVLLVASFLLKLHHLDHAAVKPLDELFHAIVSRNLLKHPLTPTLVDRPFLRYDYRDWQANHIWLHKPPMALWQIALSYAILGVNTFALRLPSAILSTLAAWLTYLIGTELLDATAGLIAAGLQAFNPVILMVVHGYVFSDHVDIALLFWTEASIWFLARSLRTGKNRDWILAGAAEGLAFLSKTYPALIVVGLAMVVLLLRPAAGRVRRKQIAMLLVAAAVIAVPWNLYAFMQFPDEFSYENFNILRHLTENVEQWAAPWDRVVFDYWISVFYVFYPAVLAAAIFTLVRAVQTKSIGLWLILAWAVGVAVPNLLATSKTMTATLTGWPAMWLSLGFLMSSALKKDRWALGICTVSMLWAVTFLKAGDIPREGWGYDSNQIAAIMRQHLWVIGHLLAALIAGFFIARLPWRRTMIVIASIAMIVLLLDWTKSGRPRGYVDTAWRVTEIDQEKPAYAVLGRFASNLRDNAAFLVDENGIKFENKLVEFATDRSCYATDQADWRDGAIALMQAGAVPYLITDANEPLPLAFNDIAEGVKVYACTPTAAADARQ
jgi:4-amino-4-deoxy-L-arabinose transferase-like glycosyltransferase